MSACDISGCTPVKTSSSNGYYLIIGTKGLVDVFVETVPWKRESAYQVGGH